ncbi:hypothetical protein MLD38_014790 [Melastoma candidum]|uniref:Uncharacterized protein n=1 Tax=Melastoma candidum TaxID=119954 RepID=A0ACB9REG9_9MYRT|nr:hypothetical protein MLD38_014790 [Melastoma candidum]
MKFPGEFLTENQDIVWVFDPDMDGQEGMSSQRQPPSEVELIKERFGKLLLGEDMSGGGKGFLLLWPCQIRSRISLPLYSESKGN